MAVRWDRVLDLHLAAPYGIRRPVARVRQLTDLSQGPTLPSRGGAGFLLRLRGNLSAVARALLPAHDAPTRDRRSFVPSAVLLKGRGRDVDSLAGHERARAALTRITRHIAADHDLEPSQGEVPAYPVGRGEHP